MLVCLSHILAVPKSVLGVTILAWGNSIGDLVADVSIAREGMSEMAIAACYAGPLFNLLVGMGIGTTIGAATHGQADLGVPTPQLILTVIVLLVNLLPTPWIVRRSGWVVPKCWAKVLVAVYVAYVAISIIILLTGSS